MRHGLAIFVLALAALLAGGADAPSKPATRPDRFAAIDVLIDSGVRALAVYQVQITCTGGDATLVGVEGGQPPAFAAAPWYDKRAILNQRVIIGAYSLAPQLPTGKTRVATLMVHLKGNAAPQWHVTLQAAGGADGRAIAATASAAVQSGEANP